MGIEQLSFPISMTGRILSTLNILIDLGKSLP
jgi:hypothetical protein